MVIRQLARGLSKLAVIGSTLLFPDGGIAEGSAKPIVSPPTLAHFGVLPGYDFEMNAIVALWATLSAHEEQTEKFGIKRFAIRVYDAARINRADNRHDANRTPVDIDVLTTPFIQQSGSIVASVATPTTTMMQIKFEPMFMPKWNYLPRLYVALFHVSDTINPLPPDTVSKVGVGIARDNDPQWQFLGGNYFTSVCRPTPGAHPSAFYCHYESE